MWRIFRNDRPMIGDHLKMILDDSYKSKNR